jgi:hypothetical protein
MSSNKIETIFVKFAKSMSLEEKTAVAKEIQRNLLFVQSKKEGSTYGKGTLTAINNFLNDGKDSGGFFVPKATVDYIREKATFSTKI